MRRLAHKLIAALGRAVAREIGPALARAEVRVVERVNAHTEAQIAETEDRIRRHAEALHAGAPGAPSPARDFPLDRTPRGRSVRRDEAPSPLGSRPHP